MPNYRILLLNPHRGHGTGYIREGRCTQKKGLWGTMWLPLSLVYIATGLDAAGFSVTLIDAAAKDTDSLELIDKEAHFDLAVLSSSTPTIDDDIASVRELKAAFPGLKCALIGTHVSSLDIATMEAAPELDFVIRGEPELAALDLTHALCQSEPLSDVLGLTYRTAAGQVEQNGSRPPCAELDLLPFPAWHLLDLAPYRLPLEDRPFLMILPSRGCPMKCSFCTSNYYYGPRLRKHSPERVVAEIRHNIEQYGVTDFFFWSDTFTLNKKFAKAICRELIAAKLDIKWYANSRIDTVDLELFKLMQQSGCQTISFGIESGVQSILDRSGKGIKVDRIKEVVSLARSAGLATVGHFILGLPGETPATMRQTLRFAWSLPLQYAQFYCAVPFPGSQLYEEALAAGWIKADLPWSAFGQDRAIMQLPGLPSEQVDAVSRWAFPVFYAHPGRLLNLLRTIDKQSLLKLWRAAS